MKRSAPSIPAVSAIVPVYNKEKTLARTLRSIFQQTFQNFEIILVDDESPDGSVALAESFGDPRLRVVHQKNSGPGAARNHGIRESRAPLVAFLDADDEWLPDYLEKAVHWMMQYPKCHAACGGRIWEPGGINREAHYLQRGIGKGVWRLDPATPPEAMKELVEFFYSGSTIALKKTMLRYGGFCEERGAIPEDTYLWLQIVLNHPVYRDPAPVMIWHREDSELSSGNQKHLPVAAMVKYPAPIRRNCPAIYLPALENYLSYYAMCMARRHCWYGEGGATRHLLREYRALPGDGPARATLYGASFFAPLLTLGRLIPGARNLVRGLGDLRFPWLGRSTARPA